MNRPYTRTNIRNAVKVLGVKNDESEKRKVYYKLGNYFSGKGHF
jgi:hypothetical protein